MAIQSIDDNFLDDLIREAEKSPRRRFTKNLTDKSCNIQALYTALFGNSYIRPHKHELKREIIRPIRGRVLVIEFDDVGNVKEKYFLGENTPIREVIIGANTWHTLVGVSYTAIIANLCEGPYNEQNITEYLEDTPEEMSEAAKAYLDKLMKF